MIEPDIGSVLWVQDKSQRVQINGLL